MPIRRPSSRASSNEAGNYLPDELTRLSPSCHSIASYRTITIWAIRSTRLNLVVLAAKVQQNHFDFAAIAGIDGRRCIGYGDGVLQRQAAARAHLRFVARWQLNGQSVASRGRPPVPFPTPWSGRVKIARWRICGREPARSGVSAMDSNPRKSINRSKLVKVVYLYG